MLFKPEQKELVGSQWEQLTAARLGCGNIWQEAWESAYVDLETAFVRAEESDAPKAWETLRLRGRMLRDLMRQADGEYADLYLKLVALTDTIEAALDEAATPANLVPRGELRDLIERVERQIELTQEERRQTTVMQQSLRRRLDEIEAELKTGRGKLQFHVENLISVEFGINELISAIKDGIIAIKNGVELLNDPRFTEALRRGAQKLFTATKRFGRAVKERFATFRVPWPKDAADDYFERIEPTFGFPPDDVQAPPPAGITILVRDGARDREERRVPGAGKPFCDVWEIGGRRFSGPEMVAVPPGSFMMGSPDDELGREGWKMGTETPQHKVAIVQPFAIGRYAITRGQFAAFIDNSGHQIESGAYVRKRSGMFFWKIEKGDFDPSKSWRNPGFAQDDDHPVVCVSHDDAQAYAGWLAEKTGKGYRLPSEVEWEYVCRASTETPFWWGASIKPEQANYNGNYTYASGGPKGKYRKGTVSVASFQPNPWGLYQVHGNAWEWCEDVWCDSYEDAPSDGAALMQGGDGSRHVLRGGAWGSIPHSLRAAYRSGFTTVERYSSVGFRLARTLPL